MSLTKLLTILVILFFVFVTLSHAEASACPEGTEGGICVTCSGTACMNVPNQEICKGKYVDDYFGWSLWIGGSSPCECYCPFSTYMSYYQNKCPTCPTTKCSEDYVLTGGVCDWTTQGECNYYGSIYCENGCDSATNTCKGAEEIPEVDLCANKNCPSVDCSGSILKSGSTGCDKTTGKCTYSTETTCAQGCNSNGTACKLEQIVEDKKPAPKDPCENITCKNSCKTGNFGTNLTGQLNYNGVCDSSLIQVGKDLCKYETKNCSKCTPDGKDCVEICDNGKNDNLDERVDCEDPTCSTSPACKCLYTYDGINWTPIAEGTGPSGQVNIILVGTGYGNVEETKRDETLFKEVSTIITAFNLVEPYKSNLNKIRFYTTRTNVYSGIQGLYSPQAQGMKKCNASNNAHYIILHGDSSAEGGRADICGSTADIYKTLTLTNNKLQLYALHEFGHSFGCLWDEYNTQYDDFSSFLFTDANVEKQKDVYREKIAQAKKENNISELEKYKKLFVEAGAKETQIKDVSMFTTARKTPQWMTHALYYDKTNCSTYSDKTGLDCVEDFKSILSSKSWFSGTPSCYAECTAPYWFKSTNKDTIMRDVQDGGWDSFLTGEETPSYSPTARAYIESKLIGSQITRWIKPIPLSPPDTGAGGALPEEWAK